MEAVGWILAVWRCDARQRVGAIRDGCVRGRYWLRAYAALPDRLVLLVYPLEERAALLAYLDSIAEAAPEKLRPIKDDADLERAARYVEALPVRSRLADRPEDYPWSSLGWVSAPESSRPRVPGRP